MIEDGLTNSELYTQIFIYFLLKAAGIPLPALSLSKDIFYGEVWFL
jgi:hypothetical protein